MFGNGILVCPVGEQSTVDVARWIATCSTQIEIIVVVRVTGAPHRLDVNQGGSTTSHGEFTSHRCRGVELGWIRAVDSP